jgi:hypothetical protein
MHYLIQSNIQYDPEHDKIWDVLDELQLSYEPIELAGQTDLDAVRTERKDIFVYGSVKLARLAKERSDWNPGSFYGGNHLFKAHAPYYKDHLLNYDARVFRFGEQFQWKKDEQWFIKPHEDAKVFTGSIFTEMKWNDFVSNSLNNPRTPLLHAETLVQASRPRQLYKEARVWIVGKQVVAATYYKFHGNTLFEQEVDREGLDFVQQMIGIFNVAEAFVMDIGFTSEGWKIVEINCINSAGFYNIPIKPLFRSLEL